MKTKTSSAAALSSRFSPVVVRPRALLPVASPLLCVCTQKKERKKERKKEKKNDASSKIFFISFYVFSFLCVPQKHL